MSQPNDAININAKHEAEELLRRLWADWNTVMLNPDRKEALNSLRTLWKKYAGPAGIRFSGIHPAGVDLDIDGFHDFFAGIIQALHPFQVTILSCTADDRNVVTTLLRFDGTHTGEGLGLPPTGRKVSAYGIALNTVRNGKLVAQTAVYDMMAVMMQVGAVPMPAVPPGSAPSSLGHPLYAGPTTTSSTTGTTTKTGHTASTTGGSSLPTRA